LLSMNPRALQPGQPAPEFHLPPENGVCATVYERYCGRPLVMLLAADPSAFAGFERSGLGQQVLGLVPGAWGFDVHAAIPVMADDGRVRDVLLGPDAGFPQTPVALAFDSTLRLRERTSAADPQAVAVMLVTMSHDSAGPLRLAAAAPVLMLPAVLDPELCARLMAAHDRRSETSGMVRVREGFRTVLADPSVKARRDHALTDPDLVEATVGAIQGNVLPGIAQAFRFTVAHMEGFKIAAYDAATGGYFRPHRDNVTADTAHRQFALSVNLNDAYAGGTLRFPEFGQTEYRPPAGGAIAFSGGLLHEVLPVSEGRRYVLLTFVW
jgi:predicted 2-oxoglutarate/Fe(II)-dependent dioxygenase YbiX